MGQLRLWVSAGAMVLAGSAACGQEFSSSQSTATIGSGSGSGGGAASTGTGAGLPGCMAGDFDFDIEPLLYTTLDDFDATVQPEIGLLGAGIESLLFYEPTPDHFGVVLESNGGTFGYPTTNVNFSKSTIDPRAATIDFCFKPFHNSNDNKRHNFFRIVEGGAGSHTPLRFFKSSEGNHLVLEVDGQPAFVTVDPSYKSGEWIRLTVSWGGSESVESFEAAVAINGDELDEDLGVPQFEPTKPLPEARPELALQFGDPMEGGNESPDGVLDELHVYDGKIEVVDGP